MPPQIFKHYSTVNPRRINKQINFNF